MTQKVIPSHLIPPSLPLSLPCANSSQVILGTSAHIHNHTSDVNGSGNGSGSGNAYTYSTEDRFRLPSSSSSSTLNNDSVSGPLSSSNSGNSNSNTSSKIINSKRSKSEKYHPNENDGLCLDQRGFFAHLTPRSLIISTLRISLIQASQIFTTYLTDQLAHESDLEEQLVAGEITDLQLDYETALWEEKEWDSRWKSIIGKNWYDWEHGKIQKALVKYHVLTLVMRSYEAALGWKLSREMMDRLTKDTFRHAKRRAVERERNQEMSMSGRPGSGPNAGNTTMSYRMEMFQSCLYANMVSFLSDYTIQQTILCYVYYTYLKNFRRERRLNMLMNTCDDDDNDDDNLNLKNHDSKQHRGPKLEDDLVNGGEGKVEDTPADADADATKWNDYDSDDDRDSDADSDTTLALDSSNSEGGIILSFIYKSSKLIVVRAIGLLVAGIGGAIGSTIRPGYGTLLGTQLGDACVGVFLEE